MTNSDAETCRKIAERLRIAIEATPLKNLKTGTNYGPVTVSIGICMGDQAQDCHDLYRRCDLALYTAKAAGRNRTQLFYNGMEGEFAQRQASLPPRHCLTRPASTGRAVPDAAGRRRAAGA